MKRGGFSVDECGVSYYPTSSNSPRDRLQAFKDMAQAVRKATGRPIFIAEFGYPAAQMHGIFSWNDAVKDYALTSEGQSNFIRDLVAWGAETGVISGMRPWAPDLAAPGWGPMSFFAHVAASGQKIVTARPALDAIAKGLQAANREPTPKI
jgi:arabinogalactan endo-1,4-beta-galactosidase